MRELQDAGSPPSLRASTGTSTRIVEVAGHSFDGATPRPARTCCNRVGVGSGGGMPRLLGRAADQLAGLG